MRSASRRTLLARAGLATAGAAIPATVALAAPPHPDAALLLLAGELEAVWRAEKAVFAGLRGDETDEAEAARYRAIDAASEVAERIGALPATSLDGLRIKARAASWARDGYPYDPGDENTT